MGVQTCPRRVEDGRADPSSPFVGSGEGLDEWRALRPLGGGEKVAPDGCRQCSYCGSLHPDDFMQAVRRGDVIGPTDKNYKAYVGVPFTAEEAEAFNQRMQGGIDGYTPTRDYGKFYFQHLTAEQCVEFVELLNAKTVHVGYPGHFYRLPFFISQAGR